MSTELDSKQFFFSLDIETPSRYSPEKFLNFVNGNFDPLTSYLFNNLKNLPQTGSFKIQGEDARPDLISFKAYEDVQYWWLILLYNGITSVEDLVTGMNLKLFSLDDLEEFYFELKTRKE